MRFATTFSIGWIACAVAPGCTTVRDIVDGGDPTFNISTLSVGELNLRRKTSDESYREPRDERRVRESLTAALDSVSPENDYAALWRAVRAAAWLAQFCESRDDRLAYGKEGIRLGKAAIELDPLKTRPEAFYFLALAMANFCEVQGTCAPEFVAEIRDQALAALRNDAAFDHCGPSRFVGELIVQASEYPGFNVGDFEDGLEHLQRATTDCPDFAENWLLLGLALLDDGDDEAAKVALEKVLQLQAPADYSVEHKAWVERAKEALAEI